MLAEEAAAGAAVIATAPSRTLFKFRFTPTAFNIFRSSFDRTQVRRRSPRLQARGAHNECASSHLFHNGPVDDAARLAKVVLALARNFELARKPLLASAAVSGIDQSTRQLENSQIWSLWGYASNSLHPQPHASCRRTKPLSPEIKRARLRYALGTAAQHDNQNEYP